VVAAKSADTLLRPRVPLGRTHAKPIY
jgi:hypothetical protein